MNFLIGTVSEAFLDGIQAADTAQYVPRAFSDTTNALASAGTASATNEGHIWVVLIVTLLVWGGLFAYMVYLDRKVNRIKEQLPVDQEEVH
ncbi:MAG: hypothetical protein D6681_12970 [Calditrichaeota bacterium]|nr:MAG: hypothetical protein D6681_12970 [Calditrichota bacterium]